MKKYIKPELYFESFTLSQHIADCAVEWRNNTDMSACFVVGDVDDGFSFITQGFTEANQACSEKLSGLEIFCNTNGTGANLFQS